MSDDKITQLIEKAQTDMRKTILKLALAALAALSIETASLACTNVIITRGATRDGSVLVSYAADSHYLFGELYYRPAKDWKAGKMLEIYEWDTNRYLGEIEQVAHTYQTVGNMNEHQVIITETTWGGRPELEDKKGGIDYGSLIYVTLQRAKSAREAIDIIVDLANTYGYSSDISPVSSTRTSVCSWIHLHTRYMPMLARMVVMSQVPRSSTTVGRASSTSFSLMMTSVWSEPI